MFLVLLAIISNTGEDSINNIQNQMFLMNCPLPTFSVLPTPTNITGFTVEYTIDYNATAHANKVVVFQCTVTDNLFGVNTIVYLPSEGFFSAFDNAFAWIGYVYSTLTALFQRIVALFTLIGFFIAPTNFNILGYNINDIGGIALMFVISIYGICYIAIGAMIYKIVSPTSGVS